MSTYTVFRRSARNLSEFASARKYIVERGLSLDEARRLCQQFNDNRTASQIRRGTKYEFISEGK